MQDKLEDDLPSGQSEGGPDPVDVHVGFRVQARREELGLSQKDLGRAVGVTYQQIQKYEKALNRISISALAKIAEVLHSTVEWFYEGAPGMSTVRKGFASGQQSKLEGMPPTMNGLDPKLAASKEAQKLINAYFAITNKKKRQNILKLIEDMAGDDT